MLKVGSPPELSGGTNRVRPDRRILSIASLIRASLSPCVDGRVAASAGTCAPMTPSVESISAADRATDGANGLRGLATDSYHGATPCRGGASRGDSEGARGEVS